jgi:LDH2 family malate/lactate/ureidoglycolate dehydrogenase
VLVEHETAAVATLDGSRALGHVAATKAMELAIKKAQEVGTGTVVVHHSQHLGAASTYASLAAKAGLIGFCTSNWGGASVTAPGSHSPVVANAPLAWSIPTADGGPIIVDLATGEASWGKLQILQQYGLPLPGGVAVDATGAPAAELGTAKAVMPLAGGRGLGLSLVASLLSGGLAGGKQPHQKTRSASSECAEHMLMAIDIGHFTDRERFLQRASEARQAIRNLPATDPVQAVRAPGDRGSQAEQERSEHGIPVHVQDLEALGKCARKLKLETPWTVAG